MAETPDGHAASRPGMSEDDDPDSPARAFLLLPPVPPGRPRGRRALGEADAGGRGGGQRRAQDAAQPPQHAAQAGRRCGGAARRDRGDLRACDPRRDRERVPVEHAVAAAGLCRDPRPAARPHSSQGSGAEVRLRRAGARIRSRRRCSGRCSMPRRRCRSACCCRRCRRRASTWRWSSTNTAVSTGWSPSRISSSRSSAPSPTSTTKTRASSGPRKLPAFRGPVADGSRRLRELPPVSSWPTPRSPRRSIRSAAWSSDSPAASRSGARWCRIPTVTNSR